MGFKTYSANPKLKAAQPSIMRAHQAGHGRVLNQHRESKGESITQNAHWLQTGQKPAVPAAVSRHAARTIQKQTTGTAMTDCLFLFFSMLCLC